MPRKFNWISCYYLRYAGLGYSIIPVHTLSYGNLDTAKRSLVRWKEYQKVPADIDTLVHWALTWPKAGVAIVTGLTSDLIVIDDDRSGRPSLVAAERDEAAERKYQVFLKRYGTHAKLAEMYKAADDFCTALAAIPTAVVRTGRGWHYYFTMPRDAYGLQIPIGDSVKFLPGLDTRAEGGYVLAPPSVHPNGSTYQWESPPEDGVATLPNWVYQAITNLPNASHYVPEEENDPEPGSLRPREGKWKLGQLGQVPEGERNDTLASYVGRLITVDYPDQSRWSDIYFSHVVPWNTSNVPPMPLEELTATWKSITDREKRKRGTFIEPTARSASSVWNGEEPIFVTARTIETTKLEAPGFAVRDFVLDGTTQLMGKPKSGKSALALQIAVAVASGQPLFLPNAAMYAYANHPQGYGTTQGDVLYLALEDSQLRLKTRMRQIIGGDGWPTNLSFSFLWPSCHEGGLGKLQGWILESLATRRLIVIDTVAAFMGAGSQDKGSAFRAEYRMFRPIWELSKEYKIPILLVDHASKGKGKFGSQDAFDSGAGTLGSQAAVDTVMVMEHSDKEARARLSIKGRDVERGIVDLEHAAKSLVWKIALPKTEDSGEKSSTKSASGEKTSKNGHAKAIITPNDPFFAVGGTFAPQS